MPKRTYEVLYASDVEQEGRASPPVQPIPRRPQSEPKRKAEEEARGREQTKIAKQPQLQSSEPTTVVFIQALIAKNPPAVDRTLRGNNENPEFLVCKRKTNPGSGKWAFPGGPLPPDKTIREAALHYVHTEGGRDRYTGGGEFRVFRAIDTFMDDEITGEKQHLVTLFVMCGEDRNYLPTYAVRPATHHQFLDWAGISGLTPLFEPVAGLIGQTVKIEKKILVDWKTEPGFGS